MNSIESEYIEQCAAGVTLIIEGRASVEGIRKSLWWWLKEHGIVTPWDSTGLEPGSAERDCLELCIPVRGIRDCASWVRGRRPGARVVEPHWELIFMRGEPQFGEMVRKRWMLCGRDQNTVISGERMIAPKDHPIWKTFGDFGRPWGPYFREEMGGHLSLMTLGVGFKKAVDLGIWSVEMKVNPLQLGIRDEHGTTEFMVNTWRSNPSYAMTSRLPPVVIEREHWTDWSRAVYKLD